MSFSTILFLVFEARAWIQSRFSLFIIDRQVQIRRAGLFVVLAAFARVFRWLVARIGANSLTLFLPSRASSSRPSHIPCSNSATVCETKPAITPSRKPLKSPPLEQNRTFSKPNNDDDSNSKGRRKRQIATRKKGEPIISVAVGLTI